MEIRAPQCRNAWWGTDKSAAPHEPHEFFPWQWSDVSKCPGWTAEEAAGMTVIEAMRTVDRRVPGLTLECHPQVIHAICQVLIPDFGETGTLGAGAPIFGIPIVETLLKRGVWQLVGRQVITEGTVPVA
jgi:hypothetical protein